MKNSIMKIMRSYAFWFVVVSVISMGLIGWGVYMIWPEATPLAIGALLWIDLNRPSLV